MRSKPNVREAMRAARAKLDRIELLLTEERGKYTRADEFRTWEMYNDSAATVQRLSREIEREEKEHAHVHN